MKKYFPLFLLLLLFLDACKPKPPISSAQKDRQLIDYVNPFIGTGGHGHTYPGATMPFGMMQLSPDTRLDGWDGCSGYHYSDNEIFGFSHTHLSGTGVSDYGDILLMPTNKVVFNNGADGKEGYKSKFSHDKEIAEPGYYKVHLEDTNIDVELTVSERSGIQKYQFADGSKQVIILDLEHRDEVLDSKLTINSKTEISGHRFSKAWATEQKLFFDMLFSKPFTKVTFLDGKTSGKKVKAAFEFDNTTGNEINVTVGISPVDEEGAIHNWQLEIGNKPFEQVKKEAQEIWEDQLEKIVIEGDSFDYKTNFYTSMYHTMIAPNLYQDVDGRYRGMDLKIHETKDFEYYTVFSLWDT
ncbi:MAG: GH92 family glycosyl hydrolase, partial [Polaribacter sp.]|nr:GH92 family glycosyl hydrolase [Polaribacter sp.]